MVTSDSPAPLGSGLAVSDLALAEAPLDPRRAAATMLAVAETAAFDPPPIAVPAQLSACQMHLAPSSSVHLTPSYGAGAPSLAVSSAAAGAAVGRAYHLLLVGRAPSSNVDAFEPYLVGAIPPSQCALIARSASESPAQWPDVTEWVDALTGFCGNQRLAAPAALLRRQRATRIRARVAIVVVVVATAAVMLLAPRWLDAMSEQSNPATDVQPGLPSAMSY